jgi:hypothetical protein
MRGMTPSMRSPPYWKTQTPDLAVASITPFARRLSRPCLLPGLAQVMRLGLAPVTDAIAGCSWAHARVICRLEPDVHKAVVRT